MTDGPLRRTYRSPVLRVRERAFIWGARTYVMGIINATPDSFSGDGIAGDPEAAAGLARRFEAEGADILDVGGESTRPGAAPVAREEELSRVLPVIEAIRAVSQLPIAIDSSHASVAKAALAAGADLINDVSGLRGDTAMVRTAWERGAPVIAMHNQRGRDSHDVIGDIRRGMHESLRVAATGNVPREYLILDPGFGFGWTPLQNFEMLRRLREFWDFELPILVGTSRKSSIGLVLGSDVQDRFEGTAATVALAIAGGADIIRVHEVREMARVAKVADAVVRANWTPP